MVLEQNIPNYIKEKILHHGKRCDIFLATRISDGQKVAIKAPHDTNEYSLSISRLHNEFEIGSGLKHKNIVSYYELLQTKHNFLLVREFFEADRLVDYIPKNGLDTSSFLIIAIQVVEALVKIHNNNIVHQLIKPSNILVNPNSKHVKILDFGRATVNYQVKSDINNFKDSIIYISPEQTGRINRGVDYRTDFYSLGLVFYKMLTGKLPYEPGTILEIMHKHIAKDVVAPHKINTDIPATLSEIVLKLLEKNADERYQSAEGLKMDLACCQENLHSKNYLEKFKIAQNDFSKKFRIPDKLYGRNNEVELLHKLFEKVCNGDTLIALVTGYSGIGKSAIVYELHKEIVIQDAYFASGKYEQLKSNIAYSAISMAFKDLLRQILSENEERVQLWKEKFLAALGTNGRVIVDIIPELELIIGKQPAVEELGSSENQIRFNMVFQKFVTVFDELLHPLVIFLDDLQWIDLASLNLIKLIIAEHKTRSIFFIGAYRSNEVDASHPTAIVLEDIKKTGVETNYINLAPLDKEDVNLWVSETLNSSKEKVVELAKLVMQKTGGNPFFVKSFLQSLYNDKLITYKGKAAWQWDVEKIKAAKPTDNVTLLMAKNIKKLSQVSCEAIKTASFIGNNFDLETISTILKLDENTTANILQPALNAGMIYKKRNSYKFIHDKVLEAAYSLIPEEERPQRHLEIGKLLLKKQKDAYSGDRLFHIVEHFNKGAILVCQEIEKEKLVEINLQVALKAKNSAAYKNAGHYFEFASNLLPENTWQTNYPTTLKLFSEWAEAEYMSINFEKAEGLFEIVLKNAKKLTDKTPVYKMILIYNENRRRFIEAVDLSIKVLSELGIDFIHPSYLTNELQEKQKRRFYKNIEGIQIRDLINLNEIKPSNEKEAIGILTNVMVPYWNSFPDALDYLSTEIVNLTIENGLSPESSLGFSILASILAPEPEKVKLAFELGKLAVDITLKFENRFYETSARYTFHNHVQFWANPLLWDIEKLIDAYHLGIDTGNIQWASYCLNHYCMRFLLAGSKLHEVKQNYDKFSQAIHSLKQEAPLTFYNPPRQATENLLGLANDYSILKGNVFDENVGLPKFKETKQQSAVGLTYIFKLLIFNVFDERKKALGIINDGETENYMRGNAGQFQPYFGLCMLGIAIGQYFDSFNPDEQKKKLQKLIGLESEFKRYAEINQANFGDLYFILLAETNRLSGDILSSIDAYDKAIELATKNGHLHLAGLVNELVAKFWQKRGKDKVANTYFREAYHFYKEWGCTPKIGQLEEKYPWIIEKTDQPGLASESTAKTLDIYSVQKATMAISSEIVTDRLLSKLMQIIIENAGAQKGYIVLKQQKRHNIVAGFNLNDTLSPGFKLECLESTKLLPETIVRYVIRTSESLVLSDAYYNGTFINDKYIRQNKSKSILAMPIRLKNETSGVLYLENNLTTSVFSSKQTKLLEVLLSQAAISLENARLFQERNEAEERLKQKNKEIATQNEEYETLNEELHQANIELVKEKERVKESVEKYKLLYNNTPVLMHSSNLEGKIISVNDFWLKTMGYDHDEVIGTKVASYMTEKSKDLYRKILGQYLKLGSLNNIEIQVIKKDGTITDMLVSSKILYGKNKQPLHTMTNLVDISLIKEAEKKQKELTKQLHRAKEKAEESDRLKTEFINNMSHEIRTPMNGILGFSGLLENPELEEAKQSHYITIIKNSGNQLLRIIDDILEISNLETKHVKAVDKEVCLNDLLLELFSIFDLKAKENKTPLYFKKGLPDEESKIFTDPIKLNKVLGNLIENAIKYTYEGHVEIGYELKDGQIEIYITDTGIGIAKEKQQIIFERFAQGEKDKSRTMGGLGLGLSIAKENTELIGGTIRLDSEKGKGSSFFVSIPYRPVNKVTEQFHQAEENPLVKKHKILIAEDEEINYLYLETLLEDYSEIVGEIIHAKNGQEAVEICKKHNNIDLILMDIKMPVMDGHEASKQIRQMLPNVPIVAQTAYSTIEDKEKALSSGCDDFVSKPISAETFDVTLKKFLTEDN